MTNSFVERMTNERNEYHKQAVSALDILEKLIKQQEIYEKKEMEFQQTIKNINEEKQRSVDVIDQLHRRHKDLLTEANRICHEADYAIEHSLKQHENETLNLRCSVRQQEIQITSLKSQIETLEAEKQETMNMYYEVMAKIKPVKEKEASPEVIIIDSE